MKGNQSELKLCGNIAQYQPRVGCTCVDCFLNDESVGKWRIRFTVELNGEVVQDITPMACFALFDTMEAALARMESYRGKMTKVMKRVEDQMASASDSAQKPHFDC